MHHTFQEDGDKDLSSLRTALLLLLLLTVLLLLMVLTEASLLMALLVQRVLTEASLLAVGAAVLPCTTQSR